MHTKWNVSVQSWHLFFVNPRITLNKNCFPWYHFTKLNTAIYTQFPELGFLKPFVIVLRDLRTSIPQYASKDEVIANYWVILHAGSWKNFFTKAENRIVCYRNHEYPYCRCLFFVITVWIYSVLCFPSCQLSSLLDHGLLLQQLQLEKGGIEKIGKGPMVGFDRA